MIHYLFPQSIIHRTALTAMLVATLLVTHISGLYAQETKESIIPPALQSWDEDDILALVFEDSFSDYDLDANGLISPEEETTMREARFHHLDKNESMLLEQAELTSFITELIDKNIKSTLNGATESKNASILEIMQSEFFSLMLNAASIQLINHAFKDFDRNNDKALSQEEFSMLYTSIDEGKLDHYLDIF